MRMVLGSLLPDIFHHEGHEVHEGKSLSFRTIVVNCPGPNFVFFALFAVKFPIPNLLF